MIVIDLQMWPRGDETKKYSLGAVVIVNVGGTLDMGEYEVRILKSASHGAKKAGVWKAGKVSGFPRLRLGATDLLLRALVACIGYRSKEAAAEAQRGADLGDAPAVAELES